MNAEEKDNMTQQFIRTREKVKELQRNFNETIEMIDMYKDMMINVQITTLKEKKKERWWNR